MFETRVNAFGLSAFRDGLFEVMDEGSQLVAELVAPPPGGRVVDACAGAGGKTLALGAALAGKGRVLALDTDGKKLEELRRRARRAGLTNVQATPVGAGAGDVAKAAPGTHDRVLVDAPCSGLGTLRRNPEARWRLRPAEVAAFPARQLALLVTLRAADGRRRAPDLRDLHRQPARERGRRRALPRRARRLRAGARSRRSGAASAPRSWATA